MFARASLVFSALIAAAPATASNLGATAVALTQGNVAGGAGHIHAEVEVSGAVNSFGWRAYASADGAIFGATLIGSFGPVAAHAGQVVIEQDVTLPATLHGAYFLAIELDPSNALAESNELDNALVSSARTRIGARTSDLYVSDVRLLTSAARAGEAVVVEASVENHGAATVSFDLVSYASEDAAVTPDDHELARTNVSLGAGQSSRVRLPGSLPAVLAAGDYTIGVWADPAGRTGELRASDNLGLASAVLNVFQDTLVLGTVDLPAGTVFINYFALLDASGGDGHFQFAVSHGRLPSGLHLDGSTGRITGIPLESGRHEMSIEVRSNGLVAENPINLDISESGVDLAVATTALETGTLGLPYEANLVAAGGEPPYEWTPLSGALPPGLDASTNGAIRGVPTQEGTFSFRMQVTDALGGHIDADFEIQIGAPNVVILSQTLAPLSLGVEVMVQLNRSGGAEPFKWEALSAPPPGLTLNEDGQLSGTPTKLGDFAVRVRVTDSSRSPRSDTSLVHVRVEDSGSFDIQGATVPRLGLRERLDLTLGLQGGTAPFAWRLGLGDSLPEGFSMKQGDDGSLRISGASIRPIDTAATVVVRDAAGRERSALLVFHVDPAVRADSGGCQSVAGEGLSGVLCGLVALLSLRRRRAALR
ncbi:MAG: Ig domain-containing protein [Myxococcota bacterium]